MGARWARPQTKTHELLPGVEVLAVGSRILESEPTRVEQIEVFDTRIVRRVPSDFDES